MKQFLKTITVVVFTIILTTLTINAGDNFHNISNSMIGSVLPFSQNVCPSDMVFVGTEEGGFCIDMYEASPSKECVYKDPLNQDDTRVNLQHKDCIPVSEPERVPWRFVAQHQASLACTKAGKRLPTNEEWYRASMGTPDGEGVDVCAIGKTGVSRPFKTGSFAECVSIAGAYDMVGNVWEWIDETVVDGEYRRRTLPQDGYVAAVGTDGVPTETTADADPNFNQDYFWINNTGTRGMFRGGYWGLTERAGVYGIYSIMNPSFVGKGLGFRCVK